MAFKLSKPKTTFQFHCQPGNVPFAILPAENVGPVGNLNFDRGCAYGEVAEKIAELMTADENAVIEATEGWTRVNRQYNNTDLVITAMECDGVEVRDSAHDEWKAAQEAEKAGAAKPGKKSSKKKTPVKFD